MQTEMITFRAFAYGATIRAMRVLQAANHISSIRLLPAISRSRVLCGKPSRLGNCMWYQIARNARRSLPEVYCTSWDNAPFSSLGAAAVDAISTSIDREDAF
jgi:hypothetical protein